MLRFWVNSSFKGLDPHSDGVENHRVCKHIIKWRSRYSEFAEPSKFDRQTGSVKKTDKVSQKALAVVNDFVSSITNIQYIMYSITDTFISSA